MVWYGLAEIGSSVVLDRIAKWYFKFDLVQLLAFVLETHFANIQAKMIFFLVVVANFHLVHYGTCVRWVALRSWIHPMDS